MACCQEMGVTSRSSRTSAQGASAERLRASSALAPVSVTKASKGPMSRTRALSAVLSDLSFLLLGVLRRSLGH